MKFSERLNELPATHFLKFLKLTNPSNMKVTESGIVFI